MAFADLGSCPSVGPQAHALTLDGRQRLPGPRQHGPPLLLAQLVIRIRSATDRQLSECEALLLVAAVAPDLVERQTSRHGQGPGARFLDPMTGLDRLKEAQERIVDDLPAMLPCSSAEAALQIAIDRERMLPVPGPDQLFCRGDEFG